VPKISSRLSVCVLALLLASVSPAIAATHQVPAGGDLQAALNAAQPGDVLLLAPGATYTGNFTLPVKNGTAFITVRSGASDRDLPAAGVRATPADARSFPKIRSGNGSPALATAAGTHHWRFETIEFLANSNGRGDIITLGSSSQTQAAQMPHDLVFDRVYVHGDAAVGQKRGIALNSGLTHILNSHFSDIKSVGQDSQAIAGWNGSGPYVIENNYVEAAGENVLFGGSDPNVWSNVPSDITVRRNYFTKPLAWREEKWEVKNAFELKSARRVLIEGNVFEHVWRDGQPGFAVLFTVRNQDGKAPWSVIEDVTFRYNIIRHAGGAINMTGYDNNHPSAQTRRIRIAHNLVYDIDRTRWDGNGDFVQIGNAPRDVIVEHNTVVHSGTALHAYGKNYSGAPHIEGVVFRDNFLRHNSYGVIGDNAGGFGQPTLATYFPGIEFAGNVLAGGSASKYPAGNHFPSVAEFEAQFVNAAQENYALAPGSRYRTSGSDGGPVGADVTTLQQFMGGGPGAGRPAGPSPLPLPVPGDGESDGGWDVLRPRIIPPPL
jgi:hypothetical protein